MEPDSPVTFEQHQLQRGLVDREVGIARPGLGGADTEHAGVEVDGLIQVGDVEGQLQSHDSLLFHRHSSMRLGWTIANPSTIVNGR